MLIPFNEIVDLFGGVRGFDEIKNSDAIKNKFLSSNGIELLRISYREYDRIEDILRKKVG